MTTPTTPNPKKLSPLAQAALALDDEFAQLERISGEIGRTAIDTDNGLERARILLGRFGECGERVGNSIQALARALGEAQARAQQAAQAVAERAAAVQARQQEADRLVGKFQALGERVRQVNDAVVRLAQAGQARLVEEQRDAFLRALPELDSKLGELIDEALKIKDEAQSSNLKGLTRDADALGQSMQAMRRKLGGIGGRASG